MPDLFWVGDGDAFSPIAIPVLLDELTGKLDSLSGGGASLQHQSLDLLYHEHPLRIIQLSFASDRRLAYGQLLFVHTGIGRVEKRVGFLHLRDLSLQLQPPEIP